MADRIHLSVVTASGVVLDRMVNYVQIPAESGSVGVLAGHLPMLCAVTEGIAKCTFGEKETICLTVRNGIASVKNNKVVFLLESAVQTE
jgi:F-type H+-transporting ATPase subunit epsilon